MWTRLVQVSVLALLAQPEYVLANTMPEASEANCVKTTKIAKGTKSRTIGLYYQNSEPFNCGPAANCTTRRFRDQTYNYVSTEPLNQWIPGGQPVSQKVKFGKGCKCTGQTHQYACIWVNFPYRQYTVYNYQKGAGCAKPGRSKPILVRSPTSENKKGCYCEPNPDRCKFEGYYFWEPESKGVKPARQLRNRAGSGPFPKVSVKGP